MPSSIRCSVVIANYNHGHYLINRLSSILEQLHEDDEVIVVDDASTDNSVSIIEKIAETTPRMRFFKNAQNMGVIDTFNRGVKEAKGRYLAMQAADDRIQSGFFSKTLNALEQNPTIGLCCSLPAYCTEIVPGEVDSPISASPIIDDVNETVVFSPDRMMDIFRTTYFWVAGHTTIMRTKLFFQYGGYDKRLGPFSDWLLLHSIALKEGAIYIPQALSVFRQHQNNYSARSNKISYTQALFEKLDGEWKEIKPLFRQSTLLRFYLRPYWCWLLKKPRYWGLMAPVVFRYIHKRLKQFI